MRHKIKTFFLVLLLIPVLIFTQKENSNSLIVALKKSNPDTNRVKLLLQLSGELIYENPDTSLVLVDQAINLSEKINFKKGKGTALRNKGAIYYFQSNYNEALKYYFESISVFQELNNKTGISKALGNIGAVYMDQSNFPKALEYFFKALKIDEELDYKIGISRHCTNLGIVYKEQAAYSKALEYYSRALKIDEELKDKSGIAANLGNIGNVFMYLGNESTDVKKRNYLYKKAINYFNEALKIDEELDDKNGIAVNLGNIGNIYNYEQEYDTALIYYLKALKINEEIDDKKNQAINLGNIGTVYFKLKKHTTAEDYLKKSIAISTEINALHLTGIHEQVYSQLDSATGDYNGALLHYKQYIAARDSINSEENQRKQIQAETQYEFEKREVLAKKEQEKKDVIAAKDKQRHRLLLYCITIVLAIVLFFTFFLFNRFRLIRNQKEIIEKQKEQVEGQKKIVEEKQKEIIDSITYAQRLQQAILPALELLQKNVNEYYIFYQPKDIVAGDFYWSEVINENFFIAAADSTGHGVPGAMVSVVCSSALSRSVKEFGLVNTGEILDKTRELVIETFTKSNADVKDGMDISLLRIDKSNRKIYWSGANNPLWYLKNGEMKEIKADKQPVGRTLNTSPFITHELEYAEGIYFFLFTDGYADQFGGPKGKKFKYKQLNEMLLANYPLTMDEQYVNLKATFNNWKGKLEQVDDVCVIGIRI